jgi:hypothetical protein
VFSAECHQGVTGETFVDCCDKRVPVERVWTALSECMSSPVGMAISLLSPAYTAVHLHADIVQLQAVASLLHCE